MKNCFTEEKNLKSEMKKINYVIYDIAFDFVSDNGVFSKGKIDYGSSFLVETFLKENDNKINNLLEFNCGYGFIGIVLSKLLDCKVKMLDGNKRAVHLTMMNIKENKVNGDVLVGDNYNNITDKYDAIITNPPIRDGKDKVVSILINAQHYLNKDGCLWFVMHKDKGVKSIIKILEENAKISIVDKSKGFYVVKVKFN